MVSIKVVNEQTGNVAASIRVAVYYGGNYVEYTDSKGLAHFNDVPPGRHTVYVDGKDMGVNDLSGTTVFYI
jgi:hypothetical protein